MKFLQSVIEITGSLILSSSQYQGNSAIFLDENKQVVLKQLPFVFPDTGDIQIVAVRGTPTRTFTVGTDEAINFVGDANRGVSQKYYRDGGGINLHFQNSGSAIADCPSITGFRSRGTLANPIAVAPGDNLLNIYAFAYNGSDHAKRAGISFKVDPNVNQSAIASGTVPLSIVFQTGETQLLDRMVIHPNGNVSIGITSATTAKLHINGNCAIGYSGVQAVPADSLAVNAGIYTGTGANFFKVVGNRVTGFSRMSGIATKDLSGFSTTTVALSKLAEGYLAIYDALISHGLIG